MNRRTGLIVLVVVVIVLAAGGNLLIALTTNSGTEHRLGRIVREESVQRVHTIGERCEATEHQAKVLHHNLPPAHQNEAAWFDESHAHCLTSLAKVEARAHVHYEP